MAVFSLAKIYVRGHENNLAYVSRACSYSLLSIALSARRLKVSGMCFNDSYIVGDGILLEFFGAHDMSFFFNLFITWLLSNFSPMLISSLSVAVRDSVCILTLFMINVCILPTEFLPAMFCLLWPQSTTSYFLVFLAAIFFIILSVSSKGFTEI